MCLTLQQACGDGRSARERSSLGYDAASHDEPDRSINKHVNELFDAASRTIASVDPLGNRTSTGYDAASRPVSYN